jgi:hypothetical protein
MDLRHSDRVMPGHPDRRFSEQTSITTGELGEGARFVAGQGSYRLRRTFLRAPSQDSEHSDDLRRDELG